MREIQLPDQTEKKRELIREIISKYDCLTCGKCCRSTHKKFSLIIGYHEYCLLPIEGLQVDEYEKVFKVFFNDSKCKFSDPKKGCLEYENRPNVCKSFPLIIHEGRLCATTFCPPIDEIKKQGIAFIPIEDIRDLQVLNNYNVEVISRIAEMIGVTISLTTIEIL